MNNRGGVLQSEEHVFPECEICHSGVDVNSLQIQSHSANQLYCYGFGHISFLILNIHHIE